MDALLAPFTLPNIPPQGLLGTWQHSLFAVLTDAVKGTPQCAPLTFMLDVILGYLLHPTIDASSSAWTDTKFEARYRTNGIFDARSLSEGRTGTSGVANMFFEWG